MAQPDSQSEPLPVPATLDFQDVLRRSFDLLARNAVPLLVLAGLLVGLPSLLLRDSAVDTDLAKPGIWEGLSLSGLVLMVAQAMLHAAVASGMLRQLGGAADQKLADLLRTAGGAVLAVIGVSLIKGIVLGVLFGIGSYWWLVVPAPFLLLGIWLSARWLVAVPVAVAENLGVSDALARSRDLTAGHRWTLMAWLALLWVLTLLLGKLLAALFGVVGLGALAHGVVLVLSAALDATVAVVVYWRLINGRNLATVFD
jgi:hypothetical protein